MSERYDLLKSQGVRRPLALAFKNVGFGLSIATTFFVAVEAADGETYIVLLAVAWTVVVIGSNIESG